MRTHVSFQADTRDAADAAPPRGNDLLGELTAALQQHGAEVDPPRSIDYAFEFWIRYRGAKFYGLFSEVDDGNRQWLMSAEPPGLLWARRLFGRPADAAHGELMRVIHQALTRNPRVRSIRWYERDDWRNAPDDRWHPEPAA